VTKLGEQLRRHARDSHHQHAVYATDRWWTYGELVRCADDMRHELALSPGDVVAVLAERGIAPVLAICAAALASAVPATIDPNDRTLATRTLAGLRPAVAIGAGDAFGPSCDVLVCSGATARIARRAVPHAWEPVRRPGIAHIIFTSGTTSEAKGVVWSTSRAEFDWALREPPPLHRAAPGAIAVPLSAAFGLQDLLRSLYHGLATVLLDAPFRVGVEQARALAVNRLKLTPTHVSMLLATAAELPAVRAVVIGAAPIAPEQIDALAQRLPDARIGRSYGLTEAGAGTAVWRDHHPGKMHTVGRPIAMRAVSIRDRDGNVLPPRTWGEVVIDVPVWDRGDGYLEASPELDRRFHNARLWTGDRGLLDARGFLVLGPRVAEIIKVGGRSASAPRIEQALSGFGAVSELAVVGVADRTLGEAPCVVFVPGSDSDPAALARAAQGAVREDEVPRWFLPRPDLPRTASGKARRGVLAREASAWTETFAEAIAWGHRVYPAFFIEDDVAVVDGGLEPEFHDRDAIEPGGRALLLMERDAGRLLAVGCVRAAPAAEMRTARFVLGPFAVARRPARIAPGLVDVFASELMRLARLLPGTPAVIEYAFAGRALAFHAAGFVAVPGHPGWLCRAADPTSSGRDQGHGILVDAAREARAFAAWAQRVARAGAGRSR
jgi:acyl-CoA synthetase (AMP-forming)/AMP-acid ligase II